MKVSGLRHFHPARQGRAGRAQSQDRRRSADRAAARDDVPRQPDHARPDRERLSASWRPAGQKDPGALLTIGELSQELGVAQHILRYWETRFAQLKPMQRAGNRRYYRPADVELARRINRLLNQEGYTVRGVQKLLRDRSSDDSNMSAMPPASPRETVQESVDASDHPKPIDVFRLISLRNRLADALGSSPGLWEG